LRGLLGITEALIDYLRNSRMFLQKLATYHDGA
jgi:hypothetical protein